LQQHFGDEYSIRIFVLSPRNVATVLLIVACKNITKFANYLGMRLKLVSGFISSLLSSI